MDQHQEKKLDDLTKKVDELQVTIRKIWTLYKWTIMISIALIVLPLIGIGFAIPTFFSTYETTTLTP